MLRNKISLAAGFAAATALGLSTGAVLAGGKDYTKMNAHELAEHLIFEDQGFLLDQKTQEGGTVRDRQTQDEVQKVCSKVAGGSVSSDIATKVTALAREHLKYPDGGIKLGDWKGGEKVARSGYGFRVGHKDDDHSGKDPGGNCYACHQLDPDEIAYGTLGPSLMNYGARGTSEAILKYTYEVIYSPHAYFPCTHMPRFGANGVLTQQQIADVMAYLMSPESPVNGGAKSGGGGEGEGGGD